MATKTTKGLIATKERIAKLNGYKSFNELMHKNLLNYEEVVDIIALNYAKDLLKKAVTRARLKVKHADNTYTHSLRIIDSMGIDISVDTKHLLITKL